MACYSEMRTAVLAYADSHADMNPEDIHWEIPAKLRREMPEVASMRGSGDDVVLQVRAILVAWYRRKTGRWPPTPAKRRKSGPDATERHASASPG